MLNSLITKESLTAFFEGVSEALDISETLNQRAEDKYKAIGNWLERAESTVVKFQPHIYPQGSIALGTVIRPVNDSDEYDVDVVCVVSLAKSSITQERLKHLVGKEVADYAKANSMINPVKEGKRCWTLNYADGAQFHMDILPAIPEGGRLKLLLESRQISNEWVQHAISITDRTSRTYSQLTDEWPSSNPTGYASWFRERMRVQYDKRRQILAEAVRGKIEDVPEYKIKTPLQRAVQILKRHRDIMFEKDLDNKPISIIITTLAAHAYNDEDNVADALYNIVGRMKLFVENRNSEWWVANPVNPLENFADKWVRYPALNTKFFSWLRQVEGDFGTAVNSAGGIQQLANNLQPRLGSRVINEGLRQAELKKPILKKTIERLQNIFQVPHRQGLLWTFRPQFKATLSGRVRRNGSLYPFQSDCPPLPKGCDLSFLATTDTPEPYVVYWQIVNTGEEARSVNQLRGKIYPSNAAGKGGLIQNEGTAYTGTHWIECFIVKNGICVARSGEYVVNIA